jgi:putative PIG3 family NAD(P)H quinone oxidoreductase
VLIEVLAAGVNRPDLGQRAGRYAPPEGACPVLGLEVAGRIVAVGDGTRGWQLGDAVCALTPGGGYAQYCIAPASHCLPVPSGFGFVEAASLPEVMFTVWDNLLVRGSLRPGESVLVHGGSSGIGLCAIQLAKQFGALVHATAGTERKAQACRSVGADFAYNYHEQDWASEVRKNTSDMGVDIVLDMVAGDYVMKNLRLLAVEGRLVNIAFQKGSRIPDFDCAVILERRLRFSGSTMRPRSVEAKASIAAALKEHVWPMLEAGRIKAVIDSVFPLSEARAAHQLMESSRHIGKIVLTP